MNILIPDNWLRSYLKTKATPKQIAEYLSLCGPSVEKIQNTGAGAVYSIEVTTNRVDSMSVYGIAREAAVILPRFGIKARLQSIKVSSGHLLTKKVSYLSADIDKNLCSRFTAVLIENVKIGDSPRWMKERLSLVEVRAINNAVDISNYLMFELGQPVHTFDYDKILRGRMVLRESKREEKITTLDGKSHTLLGGDIVIEDGKARLIDLAGIMGGALSEVDLNTKNILLFVQTYNPTNIRRTSMSQAKRTAAASLFEKGTDPELVETTVRRGIELFEKICAGHSQTKILDIYPSPYKTKKIKVSIDFINSRLGAQISAKETVKILKSLKFIPKRVGKFLEIEVPSFRYTDINIPEDIVEEVARIYGYHNLATKLPEGRLPAEATISTFDLEKKIKTLLSGWGGTEVYTLSLVPKGFVEGESLKLKNPLGIDTEYLRTSLRPSLYEAAKQNSGEKDPFHLFEIANIYLPKRSTDLPEEKLTLSGIFSNYEYREAKGIIEALLKKLKITFEFRTEEARHFATSKRVKIVGYGATLGQFGVLDKGGYIYYEFDIASLSKIQKEVSTFREIPKYPPQIEDITLILPAKTKVGEVVDEFKKADSKIVKVDLVDIFQSSYTFRVHFQHPTKTLNDKEVETIRKKALNQLGKKFGANLKD